MSIDESAESVPTARRQKQVKRRKSNTLFILLTLAVLSGIGLIAYQGYRANQATNAAIAELTRLSTNASLIDAIIAQNAKTYHLNQSEIMALDRQYQADVKTQTGVATELMARPVSQMLRHYAENAQDRIVLIMLMDQRGLNVADSRMTHDYWQGDEDKFAQTMPLGPGAVHWGKAERDDVTGRRMHIVARTVINPKTGEPIGAIAIGYDAEALDR